MKKQITILSIVLLSFFSTNQTQAQQEGFIGEVKMFAGNFAPRGWALCQGQLLAISSNQALFSILGTTYGGDGRTTFQLPDLRGRVPIQQGTGPGLPNYRLGARGGEHQTHLNTANLPSHNHNVAIGAAEEATLTDPNGNYIASSGSPSFSPSTDASLAPTTTTNTGGNLPANNMQPYLGINYIIALTGTFPSRN